MNKSRIGIIGCGSRSLSIFQHLSGKVELVAISDPQARCRDIFQNSYPGNYQQYDNYPELLSRSDCEWVIIATPNYVHKEHSIAAMRAGKHVFCEKPLATSIEDCFEIAQVQLETQCQFFTDLPLRYAPLHTQIKSFIDDGSLGQIISLDFNECIGLDHGGHIVTNSWRRFSAMSGGHIVEKCCHDLDVANWFIDAMPHKIASFGGLNCFKPENQGLSAIIGPRSNGIPAYKDMKGLNGTDLSPFTSDKTVIDNQVAIIEYQNGVRASFHTNLHSADPERRFHIIGSKGCVRGDMYKNILHFTPIGHDAQTITTHITATGGHGGADTILINDFLDMMRDQHQPKSNLTACLTGTITALCMQKSMENGDIVRLDQHWARLQELHATAQKNANICSPA